MKTKGLLVVEIKTIFVWKIGQMNNDEENMFGTFP